MAVDTADPEAYVRENREDLVDVVVHGQDKFARTLALAALVEYGEEPDVRETRELLDRLVADQGP